MSDRSTRPGDILVAALPEQRPPGREQEGKRPVVLVGVPEGRTRYPIVLVVPLTSQLGTWVQENPDLYPVLPAGSGGLRQASVALLDQLRCVDARRIERFLGSLSAEQFAPLVAGLRLLLRGVLASGAEESAQTG